MKVIASATFAVQVRLPYANQRSPYEVLMKTESENPWQADVMTPPLVKNDTLFELASLLLAFSPARPTWSSSDRSNAITMRNSVQASMARAVSNKAQEVESLLYSSIAKGRLFVQPHWLESHLVTALREEVYELRQRGLFSASGVAIAGMDGIYSASDRLVHVLPCSPTALDSHTMRATKERLAFVCSELQAALDRPSLELGECYFSISPVGARLGLHMDERHEETKGEHAWELPTRRSVSWVLYLSAGEWGNKTDREMGGEFCAYCWPACQHNRHCGAHEGDLQVGWLNSTVARTSGDPVYLDSWIKRVVQNRCDNSLLLSAESSLYRLSSNGSREYLTSGFGPDSPLWPSVSQVDDVSKCHGMTPAEFFEGLRAHLPKSLRASFSGMETMSHSSYEVLKVAPCGGTLLMFDSVTIPHEVLPTVAGERVALAGWFHERQQEFPDWYGTTVDA